MRFTVQVDCPVCVRTADIEDQDPLQFGHFDDLGSIWSHKLAGAARRLAAGVRLEFIVPAVVVKRLGPGLVRRLRIGQAAAAGAPDAPFSSEGADDGVTIRPTRSRLGRTGWLLTPAPAALATTATLTLALTLCAWLLGLSRLTRLTLSFQK